ncbi:hypothetical protein NQ315_014937, partial [Exocentrus adspersus]
MLRTILQETDSDNDTKLFASYFKDYYMNVTTRWAYCHRLKSGLNTNMHVERMHRTIKYIYLGGKKVKRLDKSLHAIMKFINFAEQGKITTKIRELRKRHRKSVNLDKTLVLENGEGWDIPSSSKNNFELYHIEKIKEVCDCQLICTDCGVCIHKYTCSCIDSSVRWNMCKHIHLLCSYIKEKVENENFLPQFGRGGFGAVNVPEAEMNQSLEIDIVLSDKRSHCEKILNHLSINNTSRYKTVQEDRQEVLDLLSKLSERVQNTNSPSKLKVFKKMLIAVSPTINALENDRNSYSVYVACDVEDGTACPPGSNVVGRRVGKSLPSASVWGWGSALEPHLLIVEAGASKMPWLITSVAPWPSLRGSRTGQDVWSRVLLLVALWGCVLLLPITRWGVGSPVPAVLWIVAPPAGVISRTPVVSKRLTILWGAFSSLQ